MEKRWYELRVKLGHLGPKKAIDIMVYVWAEDTVAAYRKFRRMPAVHKGRTPNIRPLSEEEYEQLERQILRGGITLAKARRRGYTANEYYKQGKRTPMASA